LETVKGEADAKIRIFEVKNAENEAKIARKENEIIKLQENFKTEL